MAEATAESANSGTFSSTSPRARRAPQRPEIQYQQNKGRVTIIGLAIRPSVNHAMTAKYRTDAWTFRVSHVGEQRQEPEERAQAHLCARRSTPPIPHARDAAAKSNATIALGPARAGGAIKKPNSTTAASAWSRTLLTWRQPLFMPNSCASSMCERRVAGNQLAASTDVNAQAIPAGVMPCRTCAFGGDHVGVVEIHEIEASAREHTTAQVTASSARQIHHRECDARAGPVRSALCTGAGGLARARRARRWPGAFTPKPPWHRRSTVSLRPPGWRCSGSRNRCNSGWGIFDRGSVAAPAGPANRPRPRGRSRGPCGGL